MPRRCSRALRFQCSQRTETACRQPLRFPDGSSPTSCLPSKQIARASPIRSAFLRRRSPRRVNQATWPARATAPEQSFELQPSQLRLQALQLLAILWPDARSKSLQPSAPRRSLQAPSRAASRLRAKTPCEAKHRDRSSAAKLWAQAGAAATFINVSATQLDPRPAQRKSLQPLPELSPAAASGEIAAASVNPRRPAQLRYKRPRLRKWCE